MVQLCQTLPFLMKTIDFLPQLYKRQCFWLLLTNLLGVLIKIVPDEQVWEIIRLPGSHTVLHILQPCIMNRAQEGKNNIFISRISIFSLFSFLTRWHYILQYIHLSFIEYLLLNLIKWNFFCNITWLQKYKKLNTQVFCVWMLINLQYPLHSFKNKAETLTFSEIRHFNNVCIFLLLNYIIV